MHLCWLLASRIGKTNYNFWLWLEALYFAMATQTQQGIWEQNHASTLKYLGYFLNLDVFISFLKGLILSKRQKCNWNSEVAGTYFSKYISLQRFSLSLEIWWDQRNSCDNAVGLSNVLYLNHSVGNGESALCRLACVPGLSFGSC